MASNAAPLGAALLGAWLPSAPGVGDCAPPHAARTSASPIVMGKTFNLWFI
jgi:hypothetical protein